MDIQTVQHIDDGYLVNGALYVPPDPGNQHHEAVQAWIAEGNIPAPADPAPAFEPSDLDIRLAALEAKTGVTDADRQAARDELKIKEGR